MTRVLFLTGQPASRKSAIAEKLMQDGICRHVYGDDLRWRVVLKLKPELINDERVWSESLLDQLCRDEQAFESAMNDVVESVLESTSKVNLLVEAFAVSHAFFRTAFLAAATRFGASIEGTAYCWIDPSNEQILSDHDLRRRTKRKKEPAITETDVIQRREIIQRRFPPQPDFHTNDHEEMRRWITAWFRRH